MEFISPVKKLVNFFEKSRNKWKAKAQLAKKEIKLCKNRIIFLEKSKAKIKSEVAETKKQKRELELKLSQLQLNLRLQQDENKRFEEALKKNE